MSTNKTSLRHSWALRSRCLYMLERFLAMLGSQTFAHRVGLIKISSRVSEAHQVRYGQCVEGRPQEHWNAACEECISQVSA